MSYELNGHVIPNKTLMVILNNVKFHDAIDTQTFLSMRGTLKSGSCKNVGNFLEAKGFIRDAYYDGSKVMVTTRIPVAFVTDIIGGFEDEKSI